ncbi:MAG: HIT domain-containing protein [Nanobdellota archaeon]
MSEELMLYKDDLISIALSKKAVSKGHMIVKPTESMSSFGDLSDKQCDHLLYGASYGATAIFEFLKAHGSNIILTDGKELKVDVIARNENDGIDMMWQGTQKDPNSLKDDATSIKDAIDKEMWMYDNPEEAKKLSQNTSPQQQGQTIDAKENEIDDDGNEKVNYLLKSLDRIP